MQEDPNAIPVAFRKNYEDFKRNYPRFVFDQEKNLIYCKPTELDVNELDFLPTEKVIRKLEDKYKELKPAEIAAKIIQKSEKPAEIPGYQRVKRSIEEAHKKSKSIIDKGIEKMKNQKLANEAKIQIDGIRYTT